MNIESKYNLWTYSHLPYGWIIIQYPIWFKLITRKFQDQVWSESFQSREHRLMSIKHPTLFCNALLVQGVEHNFSEIETPQ